MNYCNRGMLKCATQYGSVSYMKPNSMTCFRHNSIIDLVSLKISIEIFEHCLISRALDMSKQTN